MSLLLLALACAVPPDAGKMDSGTVDPPEPVLGTFVMLDALRDLVHKDACGSIRWCARARP